MARSAARDPERAHPTCACRRAAYEVRPPQSQRRRVRKRQRPYGRTAAAKARAGTPTSRETTSLVTASASQACGRRRMGMIMSARQPTAESVSPSGPRPRRRDEATLRCPARRGGWGGRRTCPHRVGTERAQLSRHSTSPYVVDHCLASPGDWTCPVFHQTDDGLAERGNPATEGHSPGPVGRERHIRTSYRHVTGSRTAILLFRIAWSAARPDALGQAAPAGDPAGRQGRSRGTWSSMTPCVLDFTDLSST